MKVVVGCLRMGRNERFACQLVFIYNTTSRVLGTKTSRGNCKAPLTTTVMYIFDC